MQQTRKEEFKSLGNLVNSEKQCFLQVCWCLPPSPKLPSYLLYMDVIGRLAVQHVFWSFSRFSSPVLINNSLFMIRGKVVWLPIRCQEHPINKVLAYRGWWRLTTICQLTSYFCDLPQPELKLSKGVASILGNS